MCLLRNAKERKIHRLMHWDGMTNTLCTVTYKLCCRARTISVDRLRVSALRRVGGLLRRREIQDVRPFLESLLVYMKF
jgi:hypothetical protein